MIRRLGVFIGGASAQRLAHVPTVFAARRLGALGVLTVVAVGLGVAIHRSYWIPDQIARLGEDHVAVGVNGLGRDYTLNTWIPTRALLAHEVPYDPLSGSVRSKYHADLPAGLYTPSVLAFLAPVSALPLRYAIAAMTLVNVLMIWLALLVLVPPRTMARCAGVCALGLLTLNGWAGENGLLYGQPVGFLVLGLALVARGVVRQRYGVGAVVGLVLLLVKAQFALPVVVVLAALRAWRAIGWAVVATVVASLPFGLLFVLAAGGPGPALGVVRRAAQFDTANYVGAGRSDVLVLLTGGAPGQWGSAGLVGQFAVLAVLAAGAVMFGRVRTADRPIALVALIVGLDLAAVYHEWYDLIALVVPAALVLRAPRQSWRSAPLLVLATIVYVCVDVLTRGSFRYRIAHSGHLGYHLTRQLDQWWPPAVSIAFLVLALATLAVPALAGVRRRQLQSA